MLSTITQKFGATSSRQGSKFDEWFYSSQCELFKADPRHVEGGEPLARDQCIPAWALLTDGFRQSNDLAYLKYIFNANGAKFILL